MALDDVNLILLDERYERDTLPCDTFRDTCEHLVFPDTTGKYYKIKAWCYDFLYGMDKPGAKSQTRRTADTASDLSSPSQKGTCCSLDEDIFWGWCQLESSKSNVYYREACDVTYSQFAHRSLVLDPMTGDLRLPNENDPIDSSKQVRHILQSG